MTTSINMALGTHLIPNNPISLASNVWRIDVGFKLTAIDQTLQVLDSSTSFRTELNLSTTSNQIRDLIALRFGGTSRTFAVGGDRVFTDFGFHTVSFVSDGTNITCYRDGVPHGSTVPSMAISTIDFIGDRDGTSHNGDLYYLNIYSSVDTSAPLHLYDAANSDTSNTGLQPVLIDTVSANNATGVAFPTDGSAFTVVTLPNTAPTITLTSPATINITVGDTWDNSVITYTASDPEDGDITGSVDLDDTAVNDNVVGSYQVTLNVVDSENLAADEVIVTANVQAAGTPAVSTTGPFRLDETITFTPEFLTPTQATLTDWNGNVLSLTSVTATTAAIPDFITAGTAGILFGTCSLTVSDGVDTAQTSVVINPQNGYSFVNVSATPNLTDVGLAYNWGNDPVENDQVIYPSTLTVNSDLTFSGNDGVFTLYAAKNDDPVFEVFTLTLAELIALIGNLNTNNQITASQTFNINLSTATALAANEAWDAHITIGGTAYPLTVNSETSTSVNVTAPGNLPVAAVGNATLTLRHLRVAP